MQSKDPIKRQQLHSFLKDNRLTDLSFEKFSSEYSSNSEKFSSLYSYLNTNKLTDLKEEDFQKEYFGDLNPTIKKKENSTSDTNIPFLDSRKPQQVGSSVSTSSNSEKEEVLFIEPITPESQSKTDKEIQRLKNSGQEGLLEASNQLAESSFVNKEENIDELLNKYEENTLVSEQEEEEIRKAITDDDKDQSLWNQLGAGLKNVWNNFAPYSFRAETDRLKDSRKTAREILKNNDEELTSESLKDLTYKLEFDKRKQSVIDSKTEDFIETLEEDEQKKIKSNLLSSLAKNQKKSIQKKLQLEVLKKEIPQIQDDLIQLNEKSRQGVATSEDKILFDNRRSEILKKGVEFNKVINEFNDLNEEIGQTSNEIDLFKRNYNDLDNFTSRVSLGVVEIGTNLAYLLNEVNKANAITGNTATPTIPLEYSLQLENFLEREKLEIERQRGLLKRSKSVSDISDFGDLVEWGTNTIADQTGNIVVLSTTGGAGLGLTALSSGGGKAFEINQEDKKNNKVTDPLKKWASIGMSVGTTWLSEKITLGQLNKAKRAFKSIPIPSVKRKASEYLKDNYKEYFKDVSEEVLGEAFENLGSNISDKYFLDKDISMLRGFDADLVLSSAFMSNVFKVPALSRDLYKATIPKDFNQKINENLAEVLEINSTLKNSEISDFEKSKLQERLDKKLEENNTLMQKSFENLDNLSSKQKNRILEIEQEIFNYRKEYSRINKSNIPQSQKQSMLNEIEKDVEVFLGEKEGILNKGKDLNVNTNNFIDSFDKVEDISSIDAGTAQIDIDGAKVSVKSEDGILNLKSISVQPNERGQGKAKNALQEVIKIADEKGVEIKLDVIPLDDSTNKEQLEKFYSDNGFTKTEGDTMVRKPKEDSSFENIDNAINITETEFNPLESEGESLGRLISQISVKKSLETVAKEHTDSYLEYLKEQNAGKEVMDSDFVKTFESRLVDALKNPNKFDPNQKRNFKNGSRIDENGKTISEQKYLSDKGNLDTNDTNVVSEKEAINVETNSNNYQVSVVNGELEINPELGNKNNVVITPSERRKIINKYKNDFDFSKGDSIDLKGKENLNETQIAELVSEQSNNPLEIAQSLSVINEIDLYNTSNQTKEDVIADTLSTYALTNNSSSEVTDLGKSYTNTGLKRNKERKNIDQIREISESQLGQTVSYQDVLDFLNSYEKISDYRSSKPNSDSLKKNLKDKFKSITGLDLNNKTLNDILNKYSNKQESNNEIDEVPFQTESNQTKIAGEQLSGLVERLERTGLSDNIEILSDNQIKNRLNSIKIGEPRLSRNLVETPFGFVHNGIVYLNRDKVKTDTPIHEFGHLWNSYVKKNNPEVYNRGLELIKDSEYHEQVKNNDVYKELSEEGKLEEALAQAIGEKGVKILKESRKKKFNSWFRSLFSKIAKGLGLRSMSGDSLSKLTLDKFTDLASAELLSGKEIKSRNNDKKQKNKQANVNQIDVVINAENAKSDERKRILDTINSKKSVSKEVKNRVVKYILDNINNKNVSKVNKREIRSLLNTIKNSKTKQTMLKSFKKVDDIFLDIENKIIYDDILKILNRKLTRKQSGRVKANLVTEDVDTVLKTVKDFLNKKQETVSPVKTNNKNNSRLSDAFNKRQELLDKENKTDKDFLQIEALSIVIDVLTGLNSKNKSTQNKLLNEAFENINSIYQNGKSNLIALKNETKEDLDNKVKEYVDDANPEGKTTTKTISELDKENKSLLNSFSRGLFTIGSGKLSGNLDSIMTIISKKGGENRDSSPLVQFVNRIKSRETLKKRRVASFSNMVSNFQKEIFGSIKKADIILNKKQYLSVKRRPDNSDANTPKIEETIPFTNSELLNLWMNYKNQDLREGLANNGFDKEFFDKLNISDSVKSYGESLFEVYEQLHIDADDVYKKMNYHSMGKQDFYAGKVYRTDVDIKKEDLKLDGGSFNVGTTGFGSQKERTKNDKPIQAVDVNTLVLRAISETSHYVAFAEIHREMNALLNSKDFAKGVRLNNGKNGDLIIEMLDFYNKRDLEKGGYKGFALLDLFGRNITRATLALKAKVGITQTISFFNGAIDMPIKTEKSFITYYNPVELVKTMRFLLKESDYLKNRYDTDGIENAVTGLSNLANKSNFSLKDNTLEANRKAFARFMNNAINISLSNVKYGDMFGLSGAVPSYLAWRDRYESQGFSKEKAHQKALKRFEASVDRSQQTTSAFGKSPFQKHPVGRYLAMFATSPIQNMQNANFHWRELIRGLSKDKEAKGTNLKNIMGILNYQFAQPMLYTYIANLMAGSLLPVLGIGEEEPDDLDISLFNSAILSNYGSIPAVGGILTLFLDKATGKDFSFGSLLNSPMISFIDDINEDLEKWIKAGNKQSQVKYRTRTIKKMSALLLAFPNILTDTYLDFEEIYWNDDVDTTVKALKALGWSNYTIESSRTKRTSRRKAKFERIKEERKWNKSVKKHERQKRIIKTKKQFRDNGNER